MKRIFRTRIKSRACENFGAVDYTITDTITECNGGLKVVTRSKGHSEGESFDQCATKFWPGVTMERAAYYRLTHGYEEVCG